MSVSSVQRVVTRAFSTHRQGEAYLCEYEVSLVDIASSRTARVTRTHARAHIQRQADRQTDHHVTKLRCKSCDPGGGGNIFGNLDSSTS